MGMMVTINQTIDQDTAELLVTEFGHNLVRVSESDVDIDTASDVDPDESLKVRPPVLAETSTSCTSPDIASTITSCSSRRSRIFCGLNSGLSALVIATIIGTPAALVWLIASIVCG